MESVQENVDTMQHLTFMLAEEEYAIRILQVKEIIEYNTLTKVPKTPAFIRGVINLRGNVVPVVDLAIKFGLPQSPVTKLSCIIIVEVDLEGEQTVMGVAVDAVREVMDLSPRDIEETPTFGTKIRVDYLQGLGKVGDKFVLILDIDRVLTSNELVEVASSAQEAGENASPSDQEGEDDSSGKKGK